MSFQKINKIKDYYEKTLKIHKSGPKAVNWKNKKSQNLRFKKICEIGILKNYKILDVGCGLGHLLDYLNHNKIKVEYKGIDISSKMINQAKLRFKMSQSKFFVKDILKINKKDIAFYKSDYVVNCGLFTVKGNIPQNDWWMYVQKMIENMFVISKRGISFNLMKSNVDYKDRHLYYQSIDKLIIFLEKNISKRIIIKNDYNLWEYTCLVYK